MADNYGAGDWALGIGSNALAGGTAGAAFGPIGAAVGAAAGAGLGALTTFEQEQAYKEEQVRQAALDRDLKNSDPLNRTLESFALAHKGHTDQAVLAAREAAARGGLTPEAQASLELQARRDASEVFTKSLPSLYEAAAAAHVQQQGQTLANYTTAQQLASSGTDYGAIMQQLSGAAMLAGKTMRQPTRIPGVQTDMAPSPWDQVAPVTPAAGPTAPTNDWVQTTNREGTVGFWSPSRQVFQTKEGIDFNNAINPNYGQATMDSTSVWDKIDSPASLGATTSKTAPAGVAYNPIGGGSAPSPMGSEGGAPQGQPVASTAVGNSAGSTGVSPHLVEAVAKGDYSQLFDILGSGAELPDETTVISRDSNYIDKPVTVYLTDPSGNKVPTLVYQPSDEDSGYNEWRAKQLTLGVDEKLLTPEAYAEWSKK